MSCIVGDDIKKISFMNNTTSFLPTTLKCSENHIELLKNLLYLNIKTLMLAA